MNIDKLSLKTQILKEIFNIAPKRYQEKDLDNHYLAKKFHISGKELKDNVDFLVETELIQRFPGASYKEDKVFEWLINEKGFDYLEKKEAEKKQENINTKLLRATIIIAVATALNVLLTLFIFILNLEKSHWSKPIALAVIGVAIAGLSGKLFKEIWDFLFQNKKEKKVKTQQNNKRGYNKKNKINFYRYIEIFALFLAIIGIFFSYYQIESPKLFVNQTIIDNGDGTGRLQVYVENKAFLKSTGTINFFRLDINPEIPHIQVGSLGPRKNITFDTDIRIYEENSTFPKNNAPHYALSSYSLPIYKLYFIMEKSSISYKISCDNCYPQGIIRRIPELGKIETEIILNQLTGEQSGVLNIYNWTTYAINDL